MLDKATQDILDLTETNELIDALFRRAPNAVVLMLRPPSSEDDPFNLRYTAKAATLRDAHQQTLALLNAGVAQVIQRLMDESFTPPGTLVFDPLPDGTAPPLTDRGPLPLPDPDPDDDDDPDSDMDWVEDGGPEDFQPA